MFKKPKRNFRGRRKDSESGDENSKQDENVSEAVEEEAPVIRLDELKKGKKKKKDKDKEKSQTEKSTAILSFGHDEHDEGTCWSSLRLTLDVVLSVKNITRLYNNFLKTDLHLSVNNWY